MCKIVYGLQVFSVILLLGNFMFKLSNVKSEFQKMTTGRIGGLSSSV